MTTRHQQPFAKVLRQAGSRLDGKVLAGTHSVCNDENNEVCFEISHYKSLSNELMDSSMKLFEANMGELYKKSNWGLDLDNKREELLHEDAQFLIVVRRPPPFAAENNTNSLLHHNDSLLAGFVHWRLDVNDDDDPTEVVIYVFELQIAKPYQRFGLGRRCMELLEQQLAPTVRIPKIMLTVFLSNQSALRFYRKLHYTPDAISPSQHGEESDYEILSKTLVF